MNLPSLLTQQVEVHKRHFTWGYRNACSVKTQAKSIAPVVHLLCIPQNTGLPHPAKGSVVCPLSGSLILCTLTSSPICTLLMLCGVIRINCLPTLLLAA